MDPAEYFTPIYRIREHSPIARMRAERRFLLIKEYEDHFLPSEKDRLGQRFRRTAAIKTFCEQQEISRQSFYRWYKAYRQCGIEGLVPRWEHRKRTSRFGLSLVPTITKVVSEIGPLRNYAAVFRKVKAACEEEGIAVPHYATFLRILKREGLAAKMAKPARLEAEPPAKPPEPPEEKIDRTTELPRSYDPGWIRFTSKRAFNIAMYKYNLILPLLDPTLDSHKKKQMIQEILDRKHFVFPGLEIKISEASLYRYISNCVFR